MSAKSDAFDKLQREIEALIKRGQEAERTVHSTTEEVSKFRQMSRGLMQEVTGGITQIAKQLNVSKDAVADVVSAFVKLKVVPDYLSAITKYQSVLVKGVEAYSVAMNDGYEDAVKFFNANKREYTEAAESNRKIVAEYEKRIAAGEKLTQKEEKKLALARKEAQELVPLLDTYRKERQEIDASAKAKDRDARASEKKAKATKDAASKGKKATQEEIKVSKELSQSLRNVLEDVSKIRAALNTGGGLKIQINNAGFTRVLNEMAEAIDRFHERAEGATPRKKNFFDQVLGTREENKKSADDISKEAKTTISEIKNQFLDPLDATLTQKISSAISKGIRSGVTEGIIELQSINPANSQLVQLANDVGLSQLQKKRLLQSLTGKKDITEIESAEIIAKNKRLASQYESRQKTARELGRVREELNFEYNVNPQEVNDRIRAKTARELAAAKREELKLERELKKEKREAYNRELNEKERVRIEKEMTEVYGEEGSQIKKLGEDLVLLRAKRREIITQGEELNKINYAELANNTRQITEKTKKWAIEMWNVENKTEKVQEALRNSQTVLTRAASLTQTFSAAISAASGLWSNMRSAATSFFRFFTNGFRRAFSYARNLAVSTIKAGYEQREKIEQAQIGFASFFGENNVEAITRKVREEAAKTPIVDAGSLASYVQQLAPVSGGNANLAVNASLGILKGLVYSGSDVSEGEYVIKNIRDVIAKGKATAIDIRQFNRALPGLEQALKESGQSAFLDKEGKLNITKANVGQILELFARLNTEENSPLKNIEEKQLKTLSGLEQLLTEKKTTATENILAKSGFFDLMYDLLGVGTENKTWDTISNFIGNKIKPVFDNLSSVLNDTDWKKVISRASDFFKNIWEEVKEAKTTIMGVVGGILGTTNTEQTLKRLSNIIREFLVGLGEGIAETVKIVSNIVKRLAGTNIEGFVKNVGKYLVSPLGKLISMFLSMGQNTVGAMSRVFANLGSLMKGLGDLSKYMRTAKAAAFANNFVEANKAKITDLNITQLQALMRGEQIPGLVAAKEYGKLGTWAKNAGNALKAFTAKLVSAVAIGGGIYTLGTIISELVRATGDANSAAAKWADAIELMTGALTGAVSGAMIGGVAGGVVGAILGTTIALLKLKAAANAAADEVANNKINETLDKERELIRQAVLDMLKAQGVNTDTGSDEGWYANEKLIQYLKEQDPDTINYHDAAMVFAEALRFKNIQKKIYDYANSNEFNTMGGKAIDFKNDTDLRNKLGEIIKYYRLNGDYFDYNTSMESVVKEFANNDAITEDQIEALVNLESELKNTESTMTTKIADPIVANSEKLDENTTMVKEAQDVMIENTKAIKENTEALLNSQEVKEYKERYGGLENGFWEKEKTSLNTILKSITSGHGLDVEGFMHDAEAFNPTAAGYGNYPTIKEGDKTYNVYADDIYNAVAKYLEEEDVPFDGTAQRIISAAEALKNEFNNTDIEGWMRKYGSDFSWLEEYLKKVILHKAVGGFIKPLFRAMGGLGVGVDSVPAMLQPGEFVMRRASVAKAGLSTMFALNRGDMAAAARSLGTRFNNSYNNSRNWNSVVNNNQKTQSNYIKIFNRNNSARVSSYYGLANRIALA